MEKLVVNLAERSYPIYIGDGLITDLGQLIKAQLPCAKRCFIISNPTVDQYYGEVVLNSLVAAGFSPAKGVMPDGEEYKSLQIASTFYDKLVEHGMDRSSVIISLGGGVVGDLAGFIAATYMRGIPFVQVPTTLLAQVDSSVGGKVAVNHLAGKNLIGAFHQPRLVLIDTATLKTLPEVEMIAGLAEVVKYGVILDADYFSWLENNLQGILTLKSAALSHLIRGACAIKGQVVEEDETEQGLRAILNFGHTVGHALEVVTNYQHYRHGEAVSIGMVLASRFSLSLQMISVSDVFRLTQLLKNIGLPVAILQDIKPEEILKAIKQDKKSFQGKIKMILPTTIGQVKITDNWQEQDLLRILKERY